MGHKTTPKFHRKLYETFGDDQIGERKENQKIR